LPPKMHHPEPVESLGNAHRACGKDKPVEFCDSNCRPEIDQSLSSDRSFKPTN
jgi:hypothetical protein